MCAMVGAFNCTRLCENHPQTHISSHPPPVSVFRLNTHGQAASTASEANAEVLAGVNDLLAEAQTELTANAATISSLRAAVADSAADGGGDGRGGSSTTNDTDR